MKLESVWRTRLKEWCKAHWGDRVYLQMAHGNEVSAGLPDIQILLGGSVVWLELKASKELSYSFLAQPTKLQSYTLHTISKAGGDARVLVFHDTHKLATCWRIDEVLRRRAGEMPPGASRVRPAHYVSDDEIRARGVSTALLASNSGTLHSLLFG